MSREVLQEVMNKIINFIIFLLLGLFIIAWIWCIFSWFDSVLHCKWLFDIIIIIIIIIIIVCGNRVASVNYLRMDQNGIKLGKRRLSLCVGVIILI